MQVPAEVIGAPGSDGVGIRPGIAAGVEAGLSPWGLESHSA